MKFKDVAIKYNLDETEFCKFMLRKGEELGLRFKPIFETIADSDVERAVHEFNYREKKQELEIERIIAQRAQEKAKEEQISNFLRTTSSSFEGYRITKYLGIYSGHCALGTSILSEISAGISDILGTDSDRMANKLFEAKNIAITRLIKQCTEVGADGVLAVDTDIMTLSNNMIVASATGTAVKLEKL